MPDKRQAVVRRLSGAGITGICLHVLLLVWIAPIAFFDEGRLASDWAETMIPFGALALPLGIAAVGRSPTAFGVAALSGLATALVFILGPGLFLIGPAVCYAIAGLRAQP